MNTLGAIKVLLVSLAFEHRVNLFGLKSALTGPQSVLSGLISALRTNRKMNESPPVYYRTSFPSGPLPCSPST